MPPRGSALVRLRLFRPLSPRYHDLIAVDNVLWLETGTCVYYLVRTFTPVLYLVCFRASMGSLLYLEVMLVRSPCGLCGRPSVRQA